jgi:hypothetical protein
MLSELFAKCSDGRSGPGIKEGGVIPGTQKGGGNRLRMAAPIQINDSGRIHGRTEFSAGAGKSIAKWGGSGEPGLRREAPECGQELLAE